MLEQTKQKQDHEFLGKCPACGNKLYGTHISFYCGNGDCGYQGFWAYVPKG